MEQLVEGLQRVQLGAGEGEEEGAVRVEVTPPSRVHFQKCWLPRRVWTALGGAPPGAPGELRAAGRRHLVRLYPHEHAHDAHAELPRSVSAACAPGPASHACAVRALPPSGRLSSLEAEVVCEGRHAPSWLGARGALGRLLARRVLRGVLVCAGAHVTLEGFPSALTCGARLLLVTRTSSPDVAAVGARTRLTVVRVLTEAQFAARSRSATERLFGADRILRELTELVDVNLEHAKLSQKCLPPIKQVLLAGPSGCGKSSVIQMLSNMKQCAIVRIQARDVYHKEPGQAEQLLRNMFKEALYYGRANELCIVLIEDIDILCPNAKNIPAHTLRLSTQLMHLLDECQETSGVVVIATTNNPSDVNLALRRHGRLAKEILMRKPSETERSEIITNFINLFGIFNLEDSTEISKTIANITPGYLGADLKLLCQVACQKICSNKTVENKIDTSINIFKDVLLGMKPASLRNEVEIVQAGNAAPELGGLDQVRKKLELTVYCSLLNPQTYQRLGIQKPRGVLLYGPPGCAKTSLVRTLAAKGSITVLCASSASIYSPYVGDAEKAIIRLFDDARQNVPAIIFFDEIDSLVGSRSINNDSNNVQERVLSALLTQMDGIGITKQVADHTKNCTDGDDVLVIAATNRPTEIDPALLRPGRFDRHIYVPPPDCKSRLDILKIVAKNTPLDDQVDLNEIARRTDYYSGADLKNLHTEAVLHAMKEEGVQVSKIKKCHYDAVLEIIKPSLNREIDEQFRKMF